MDEKTARALNRLNVTFYRERAAEFSAKRERPWAGWNRLIPLLPELPLHVLDVGCGNGRLGTFLAARRPVERYVGVDASAPLLAEARAALPPTLATELHCADFFETRPAEVLPAGPFTLVALFGVLHGVPGQARRRELLAAAASRVAPGGLLAVTCWRFVEEPALRRRIVAWDAPAARAAGVDPDRLEPGDHLLAWGVGDAVRFAHAIDEDEITRLTAGLPLEPVARFSSDGRGQALNRYLVLRATPGKAG